MKVKNAGMTLATLLVAAVMLVLPVSATESVIIKMEFNTASNESFTATVLGGSGCVSAGTASECTDVIAFNCTTGTGSCEWKNATCIGESQDPYTADKAAIILTNTGTATLDLGMELHHQNVSAVDYCLNLTYVAEQEASCTTTVQGASGTEVTSTAATIDSSFTPAETQHCVWLYGNFSGCSAGIDTTYLYFNSTVV